MSETEQISLPHLDVPNGLHKYGSSPMMQNSSYELEKSRIGGILFPQLSSLLRDCHELQARPLKSPKELSTLSPDVIPNERALSDPPQEKLGGIIDTRAIDYRCAHTESSSKSIARQPSKRLVLPEASVITSPKKKCDTTDIVPSGSRLNKFVRRLYDMLCGEKNSGIVQWRRGLLILLDTKLFAKQILPKYFNTRNFKTFRRQLNYYGFVHVRSYSNSGTKSTTALWVNQELATGNVEGQKNCIDLDSVASVLYLKRVEPCDSVKTSEGRRVRKELALSTIEDDLGVSPQTIQLQQLYVLSEECTKIDSEEAPTTVEARGALSFVEHHDWSYTVTAAAPVCIVQETPSMTSRHIQHSLPTSGNTSCRFNSSSSDDSTTKPPTSSASVANLLLLLSSG